MNINDLKISEKYDVSVNDLIRYLLRPSNYKKGIQKKKETNAAVLTAVAGGFATGFIAAALLTPESGAKLRNEIGETLKEANKKLSKLTEHEAAKIKEYVKEI